MSRIYDGLRRAGQFPDLSGAPPAAQAKETPDGELIDISEIVSQNVPTVTGVTPLQEVVADLLKQSSTAPSQNGSLGKTVKVAVSNKARILPHCTDPRPAEYYRIIRTNMLQQRSANPFRSLLVTSPSPQDGKTLTVLNLALTFAMLPSFRVLVVDGDLRNGNLGAMLGLGDVPGFSNFIENRATLDEVILKCDTLPVKFMTRGNAQLSPGELLQSRLLGNQMRRLSEHFDLVLIDSPPGMMFADTKLLASVCDGVVLVARAFSTTRKVLRQLYEDLRPFRIVGAVLNGFGEPAFQSRYHHDYRVGRTESC